MFRKEGEPNELKEELDNLRAQYEDLWRLYQRAVARNTEIDRLKLSHQIEIEILQKANDSLRRKFKRFEREMGVSAVKAAPDKSQLTIYCEGDDE